MAFSTAETQQIRTAATGLSITSPAVGFEQFCASTIGISIASVGVRLPTDKELAIAVAALTSERRHQLDKENQLPSFVVSKGPAGYEVSGLIPYLSARKRETWHRRLTYSAAVASYLKSLRQESDLEAVAAALLSMLCQQGSATKRSGDQGIDMLGVQPLMPLPSWLTGGNADDSLVLPGDQVIILGSSKATLIQPADTIDPAFIREVVGGWVIQRNSVGVWSRLPSARRRILPLSPVQMILVTTYRLSFRSWELCNDVGILVWSLPRLVYLLSRCSPASCFPRGRFDSAAFETWWKPFDRARINPA